MPCTQDATDYLLEQKVLVAPAKASNAGGVATSAIEMSQNSMRYYYTFEEVDAKLNQIMINIFNSCKNAADKYGVSGNYVAGANIAAFQKLAKSNESTRDCLKQSLLIEKNIFRYYKNIKCSTKGV